MGVSATGERHIVRPGSVPVLLVGVMLVAVAVFYVFGPPLVPGLKGAAADKCNKLNNSDYRSYLLVWDKPSKPDWDPPHWDCFDKRDPGALPVNFGWWVDPF